jgi:hypothetical protein
MNRSRVCLSPSMERSCPPASARMLLVAESKWWAIAILWRKTMRFGDGGAREAASVSSGDA